jgi:simple sugar transport system permease protein
VNIRRIASRNLNNTVLAIVLLAVMVLLALVIGNRFFTLRNFRSMAGQIPEFGLLSLAIMAAMLTGGIDLSIVATANLSGIVTAMVMTRFVGPDMNGGAVVLVVGAAIAVGLMVAVFCGALNGLLITRVGIPAIIATLGTMALYDGIGILITSGRGIVGFPEPFQFLGNGSIGPVPMAFVIFAVTVVFFALMLNRTQLGQNIKMIGANPIAARFAGLNIPLVLMKVYIMNGILAGISAMIMISRSNSAKSGYGFFLPASEHSDRGSGRDQSGRRIRKCFRRDHGNIHSSVSRERTEQSRVQSLCAGNHTRRHVAAGNGDQFLHVSPGRRKEIERRIAGSTTDWILRFF